MSRPVEDYEEEGWTVETLLWALDDPPGDLDCADDKCCAKEIEKWRAHRRVLGIWHDYIGNA